MDDKFLPENKANKKYSHLARYGLQYYCSKAMIDLRKKLSASGFEIVASLYKRVFYELLDYEEKIISGLLEGDDLRFYMSVHLDKSWTDKGTALLSKNKKEQK